MHVAGPRLRILAAAKVEGAARHLGFRGDEVRRRHVTKGRGTEETANEAADLFNQATATAQGKGWLASRRVTVCDSSRSRQGSNKERSRPHCRNESNCKRGRSLLRRAKKREGFAAPSQHPEGIARPDGDPFDPVATPLRCFCLRIHKVVA